AQVASIQKKVTAKPDRDDVDVVIAAGKLTEEHAERLRRRVVAQRTARTFAVEKGVFIIDDTAPPPSPCAIDIRPIIYLGALMNMSDERLDKTLGNLGSYFRLKIEALQDLTDYGFTDAERQIVLTLTGGASIADLESTHRNVDPRTIRAVVYTLVSG